MKSMLKPLLALMPLLLTACEDGAVRDTLGLNRNAPDEFSVVSRPPLSLPPEFSLRPPRPGEAPLGTTTDEKARSLLTGKAPATNADAQPLQTPMANANATTAPSNDSMSSGATSLLKRAGADDADTTIRSKLGEDAQRPADTSKATTLMDQISGAEKNEPTVDAKKEAERLRNNKDAGKALNDGDVPEELPEKRSLIDRIF